MFNLTGRRRPWIGVGMLAPLLALVSQADAAAEPGDHVHLGDAEIAPQLQVATEYQSNAYLEEGGENAEPDPGVSLRVRPAALLTLSNENLILSAGAGLTIRQYLTPGLNNLSRYNDFDILVNLNALPESQVGFKLTQDLRNRARAADVGDSDDPNEVVAEDATLERLSNETLALVSVRPGGALSVDFGGHFLYDRYAFPEGTVPAGEELANQKVGYGPDLNVEWRFFPKTAVVMESRLEWFNWTPNVRDTGGTSGLMGLPDGSLFEVSAGLKGRITDKLVLALLAGYGQISYSEDSVSEDPDATADLDLTEIGQDLKGFPDGLIGIAEGTYTASDTQSFTLGVRREFLDVYFTNYVDYVNFFGRYQGRYFDRLRTVGELTFRPETYVGDVNRKDNFLRARLDLAWETTEFLDLGGGVSFTSRTNPDGTNPAVEYNNLVVLLGATLSY